MVSDAETQTEEHVIHIMIDPEKLLMNCYSKGAAVTNEALASAKRKPQEQEQEEDPADEEPRRNPKRTKVQNPVYTNYSDDEKRYYAKLSKEEKSDIAKKEGDMKELNNDTIPLRFKVLTSGVDDKIKAVAIQKLNYLYTLDESCSEYYTTMNWIESVCKIPFNKYQKLAVDSKSPKQEVRKFLMDIKSNMDSKVYGHNTAKDHIVRLLAQWISNPDAKGMVIGIQGPMGCGKCFAKDTGILMADGSIKMVQDVVVGDALMGDDSLPRHVLTLGGGTDMMYKVSSSSDPDSYTVNSEHILCLKIAHPCIVSKSLNSYSARWFDKLSLTVKSMMFGTKEEATAFSSTLPFSEEDRVLEIRVVDYLQIPSTVRNHWLRGYRKPVLAWTDSGYDADCTKEAYRLGCNVHSASVASIPESIKRGTLASRLAFFDGMRNGFKETTIIIETACQTELVAQDIVFLARSVGYDVCLGRCDANGTAGNNKVVRINTKPDCELMYNISVEAVGEDKYYGFMIDGNERFMLADFTVTHNTTLIKDGICSLLGLPFAFIPLGGANDGCYLDGHSYTYQGATWGKIVDVLMKSRCMNPVLFFDELDKVSDTHKGEEIINILMHLTDTTQNDKFNDKYFSEFEFDLSRCLIIFSYNHEENINPILRDRMIKIHTKGYQPKDKIEISQKHMVPLLLGEYNFDKEGIVFPDPVLKYMIEYSEEEQGVRNLRRSIQDIVSNINLNRLLSLDDCKEEDDSEKTHVVTEAEVRKYVHNKKKDSTSHNMMYV